MGIKEWFKGGKKEVVETFIPTISEKSINLTEQFKGEVESRVVKFPAELGEEHPFDFVQLEELYKKFGFFSAVVDKYVDFVVGPGFFIECTDGRVKALIEQFMQDVNFDTLLRLWCREGLVKGNGFIELGGNKNAEIEGMKVLNANYMYVLRDKMGVIQGYNQYKGAFQKFDRVKIVNFKPWEIAHFAFNKIGDCAYGYGIGYQALKAINDLLSQEKDLHTLMNRKANSPYDVTLGKVDGNVKIIPKPEDVTAFGHTLETLHNKHEWVHDALVDIKALDFGNIGDKFTTVLQHDLDMLIYTFQIPGVLLGMANIPEGLAKTQMDAFERRIQSIQAEMEKVIEENIFKRVLNANGFVKNAEGTEVHVEFQWGQPSNQEKADRLMRLTELMRTPMLSQSFVKLMEQDLVYLLDYDENEYKTMTDEEERQREEERPQPLVPGQNETKPQLQVKKELPIQPKPEEVFDLNIKSTLVPSNLNIKSTLVPEKEEIEKILEQGEEPIGWFTRGGQRIPIFKGGRVGTPKAEPDKGDDGKDDKIQRHYKTINDLPTEHTKGIKIVQKDKAKIRVEDGDAVVTMANYNPKSDTISVYGDVGKDKIKDILQHEVGHRVSAKQLTKEKLADWNVIHSDDIKHAPTNLAKQNLFEDFSESYRLYASGKRNKLNINRRVFMDDVFKEK